MPIQLLLSSNKQLVCNGWITLPFHLITNIHEVIMKLVWFDALIDITTNLFELEWSELACLVWNLYQSYVFINMEHETGFLSLC